MNLNLRLIMVIALTMMLPGVTTARERSVGTSWSFTGVGITYEHPLKESSFLLAGAQLEMSEVFLGTTARPGGSICFTCNDILRRMTSRNGNAVSLFAGAGAAAGYSKDYRLNGRELTHHGVFFGVKGRAGVRIEYDRNINITAAVAPVLGMHLSMKDETVMMRYYRYGLLQTLMPEITISYRF